MVPTSAPAPGEVPQLDCLVAGGQTGADRAALNWAIEHRVPHGGWCPLGRLAEDGPLSARYALRETPAADYAQRTAWNVRDSDATVVFSLATELSGGSRFTVEMARELGRPWLHLPAELGVEKAARRLRDFLTRHPVHRLNVAGPRASGEPAVGRWVRNVLDRAFGPTADRSRETHRAAHPERGSVTHSGHRVPAKPPQTNPALQHSSAAAARRAALQVERRLL